MSGATLDPRILKVVVQIGTQATAYEDNGQVLGFGLIAHGTKYANPIQNECEVEIFNLAAKERNYILTEISPFNKNNDAKTITVYAGRVSTGYSLVFSGDITNANIKQPPDVAIVLKSATKQSLKSFVGAVNLGNQVKLSAIAANVAQSLGTTLNFQATDKNVAGYAFTGSQLKQVDKLADLGQVNAYIDDNELVVKNSNLPIANNVTYVSETTGMVGIPQVTEEGIEVTFLYNNVTKLGGLIVLTSVLNPSLNGTYIIFKLGFELTNRDTAFYYKATCINSSYAPIPDSNANSDFSE